MNSRQRQFLSKGGLAGTGVAASSVLALPSYSQAGGRTARATPGFLKDAIKEVADLHVPIIRFPGGNLSVNLPARSYTIVHLAV